MIFFFFNVLEMFPASINDINGHNCIGTEVDLSLSISQPNTGSPKMDQNLTGSQLQHGPKVDFLYLISIENFIFPMKIGILRFEKCK